MKLSTWAKQQGICYATALRWFHAGIMPVKAIQLNTDTILVYEEISKSTSEEKTVIYCRVSNQSRRSELEYQVKRCEDFCVASGWPIAKVYQEVASGMNDSRKQLWKMLESKPTRIVVENKDRLTRFGYKYLDLLLKELGCSIIVINTSESDEQDLMKDMISIVSSFCCRLYGLRRTKNKVDRIREVLKNND
jgi:predicted site-specific integrase-resolvase